MIIDLRYHIFSLAAVFLALGLGIAVGSALPGADPLLREQEKVISQLEKDFEQLRAERRAAEEMVRNKELELEAVQEFHRQVLPLLVGGVLDGYMVVLVHTGDTVATETTEDLRAFLRRAGAQVAAVLSFGGRPGLAKDETLAKKLGFSPGKDWVKGFWLELAAGFEKEKDSSVLSNLEELNLISRHVLSPGPVDAMILLGEKQTGAGSDILEFALAGAARETGLTVIGVESSQVKNSWIPEFKDIGLTTVDNIDTIPGRVALVYALAGAGEGHYGRKETAVALLPELPAGRTGDNE